MTNKRKRIFHIALLLVAWVLYPVTAYSGNSCEDFAAWVKPLQEYAIEDRQGNLKAKSIYNTSQAFEAYKFLFEDENFIPYFGKSFDKLSGFNRSRIYKKIQKSGAKCGKRTEPDIKFYMGLAPRIYLAEAFSEKARRGPEMSYKHVVSYVQTARTSVKVAVKNISNSQSSTKQVVKNVGNTNNSTNKVSAKKLQDVNTIDSSNECEIMTDLDLEHDPSDIKKYMLLYNGLDGEAIFRSCKQALTSNPSTLAHIRYAKALYLAHYQRQREDSNVVDEIVEHTKIAVLEKEPIAFLFLGVLKKNSFAGANEIPCGLLGRCSLEAFKLDPSNVLAQRRLHKAWKDMIDWRGRHRSNVVDLGLLSGGDKSIADSKMHLLKSSDDMFAFAKEMHAIFGAEYAYTLAEIALFDFRNDVTSQEVLAWLKEARPVTNGMSEALEARLYESRNIKLGQIASSENAKLIAELWQASADKGNPYALVRLFVENEASELEETELFDKLNAMSPSKYEESFSDVDFWYSQFWIQKAKLELDINLGPLAFRLATALIQSNPDDAPSEQAINYYRIAKGSGIQKAQIALAYLYKHGKGLPKSIDYARTHFYFAVSQARKDIRLGEFDYDPKLRELAAREYDAMSPYGDDSSSSAGLLLAVGLAILILGSADSNSSSQYTPSATTYEPPALEMWEMHGWVNPGSRPW